MPLTEAVEAIPVYKTQALEEGLGEPDVTLDEPVAAWTHWAEVQEKDHRVGFCLFILSSLEVALKE